MEIRKATMDDLKELTEIEAKCFPVEEAATEDCGYAKRLLN